MKRRSKVSGTRAKTQGRNAARLKRRGSDGPLARPNSAVARYNICSRDNERFLGTKLSGVGVGDVSQLNMLLAKSPCRIQT